jgi:hypothetical protein
MAKAGNMECFRWLPATKNEFQDIERPNHQSLIVRPSFEKKGKKSNDY